MYVEGQRIRPKTYRFSLPEHVEQDDVLFIMSRVHAALAPRDYTKDVPSAGGVISVYAFFPKPQAPKKPRGQPPRK